MYTNLCVSYDISDCTIMYLTSGTKLSLFEIEKNSIFFDGETEVMNC